MKGPAAVVAVGSIVIFAKLMSFNARTTLTMTFLIPVMTTRLYGIFRCPWLLLHLDLDMFQSRLHRYLWLHHLPSCLSSQIKTRNPSWKRVVLLWTFLNHGVARIKGDERIVEEDEDAAFHVCTSRQGLRYPRCLRVDASTDKGW